MRPEATSPTDSGSTSAKRGFVPKGQGPDDAMAVSRSLRSLESRPWPEKERTEVRVSIDSSGMFITIVYGPA